MPKNKNSYWTERARKDKLKVIKTGEQGIDNLKRLLKLNLDDVERQIAEFYNKYGDNPAEKMTYAEWEKYKARLSKMAKQNPQDEYLQFLAKQNIPKYRIDRLRALELDLQMQLTEATNGQAKGIYNTLDDVSKVSQATLANRMDKALGLTFNAISANKMKQILMSDWSGANWSERLWKDREKVGKKLTDVLQKGIPQGVSLQKMSRELRDLTGESFNNAFRLIRTETSHIDGQVTLEGYKQAGKELGLEYYEYDAFLDTRTSSICRELNGKRFKVSEAEVGANYPPMHPNCRSTTQLVLDEDYKQEEISNTKGNNGKNEKPQEIITEKSDILKALEASDIEKIPFNYFESPISTDEIINRLSGGDMTKGSCSSLAFAYAANRANMKVLDYRGGKSCDFFSTTGNIIKISELKGVESFIEKAYNDYDAVNKLLKNVVKNKEYYFTTGSHSAIIRRLDKGFEYLELQNPYDNGFKPLTNKVLKDRFSCKKTHTVSGLKIDVESLLIDIESLGNNLEFKNIVEYINTEKDNQKKGIKGFAK